MFNAGPYWNCACTAYTKAGRADRVDVREPSIAEAAATRDIASHLQSVYSFLASSRAPRSPRDIY